MSGMVSPHVAVLAEAVALGASVVVDGIPQHQVEIGFQRLADVALVHWTSPR